QLRPCDGTEQKHANEPWIQLSPDLAELLSLDEDVVKHMPIFARMLDGFRSHLARHFIDDAIIGRQIGVTGKNDAEMRLDADLELLNRRYLRAEALESGTHTIADRGYRHLQNGPRDVVSRLEMIIEAARMGSGRRGDRRQGRGAVAVLAEHLCRCPEDLLL